MWKVWKEQLYDRFVINKTKASERESLLKAFIMFVFYQKMPFELRVFSDHENSWSLTLLFAFRHFDQEKAF